MYTATIFDIGNEIFLNLEDMFRIELQQSAWQIVARFSIEKINPAHVLSIF